MKCLNPYSFILRCVILIMKEFGTIIIQDVLNLVTKGLEGERSRERIISNKFLVLKNQKTSRLGSRSLYVLFLQQMGVWFPTPTNARRLTAICDPPPPPVNSINLGFQAICTPLHKPILRSDTYTCIVKLLKVFKSQVLFLTLERIQII